MVLFCFSGSSLLLGFYCEDTLSMYRLIVAGVHVIASMDMDPNHLAQMAQMAMQHGDFAQALQYLSMSLARLPPSVPQYAAPLLAERAECLWHLGDPRASVQEMQEAIRAGLLDDGINSEVIRRTTLILPFHVVQEPTVILRSIDKSRDDRIIQKKIPWPYLCKLCLSGPVLNNYWMRFRPRKFSQEQFCSCCRSYKQMSSNQSQIAHLRP